MITNIKSNTNIQSAINETIDGVGFAYENQQLQKVAVNHKRCIVKHIHTENQFMDSDKYYIMCGRDGILYNPFDTPLQRSRMLGSDYFQWKKVSKDGYDLYIKFLDTKNTVYFDRADKLAAIGE